MGKHNDEEFKIRVVSLIIKDGKNISNVSKEVGVSIYTIRGWVKKYQSINDKNRKNLLI